MIGSGIAAQQLSPGNVGLQLFENAAANATGLFAIILMFGPVSGAHFNPAVSASFGGMSWGNVAAYIPAQVTGCITGAVLANAMFAKAAISISTTHRATPAHLLVKVIATIGLLLVIFSLVHTRRGATAPAAVGAHIGAAYFFTSSTSFANPAMSIGRRFSNTFSGIAPALRRRPARRRRPGGRAHPHALPRRHPRRGRRGHSSPTPTSPVAARTSNDPATMPSSPPDPTRRGAD